MSMNSSLWAKNSFFVLALLRRISFLTTIYRLYFSHHFTYYNSCSDFCVQLSRYCWHLSFFTCIVYFHHSTKDRNFDLAEVGIEPGAARWQSSALPYELYDLIWTKILKWSSFLVSEWLGLLVLIIRVTCLILIGENDRGETLMRIITRNWQFSWENMVPSKLMQILCKYTWTA